MGCAYAGREEVDDLALEYLWCLVSYFFTQRTKAKKCYLSKVTYLIK
jgi:hypothetical protein